MVRPLRIQFEGATYHILSKGNLDEFIFPEDKDKGYFLKLLGDGADKYRVDVFTYCLMRNHYHLLIRTQEANLPTFMHFLLSSYASYLARKGLKGHIFAGRYKAILVDIEEYLLTVSKYIHLNPVKAALTDKPSDYKWSGYRYYLHSRKVATWLKREWVVDYFGPGFCESLQRYREFVEVDMDKEYPYPHDKVIAQAILGNEEFVKVAIAKHKRSITSGEVTGKKTLLERTSINTIYLEVCRHYGLKNLKRNSCIARENCNNARRLFIYLARNYTRSSNGEIAEMIGDIGHSGVSGSYRRVKSLMEKDKRVEKEIEAAENAIACGGLTPIVENGGLTP